MLPTGRLVWNVAAREGSEVVEGQTLLDLADCRSRFLVVELPAAKIERVHVGQTARIRLLGARQWIDGRVQKITGGAAQHDTRLLAADAPKPGPHNFTVEVAIRAQAADRTPTDPRSCDIGRMADVRFGGALRPHRDARLAAADGGVARHAD